jgi:uncharacterized LabA/DUF88 family protein
MQISGGGGGGYFGPKEIKYLFIDGGCISTVLDRISATFAGGAVLDLNYEALTSNYSKVFYYDALPERKSDEDETTYRARSAPQRRLFDRLGSLDRFHVYEGDVRRSSSRRGPEQKKIDVMIAVDMLTHSFRRNMHEATLLTGDLDFKPLIDALVQQGMFVTLWYPPGTTSQELIAAADRSQRLSVVSIYDALAAPRPFVIPKAYPGQKGDYAPVLTMWPVDGGEAKLMKDGETFVVATPDPNNPGYMTYYEHTDLAILRAYLADRGGFSLPKITEENGA